MSITTPNMNLVQSTVNVDSGLAWENNLNSSLTIIDGHNHSAGNGVQINPAGLNINSALSFQNNQATSLQAAVFSQQTSLATLNSLFVKTDGNLYFNDGAGDTSIQITAGGSVNATSSGISSGTATASFVSSVLVVNAASNTPANIQGGSVLLGNNVSGSKFLTLNPPSSMAANYSLTLPSLPAQTNVMTLDTSGNMASITYDAVGQGMTSVGSNAISAVRTRATGVTVGVGGVAISASCGSFGTTGTSPAAVTNLTVTITTSGRPVNLFLASDSTGTNSFVGVTQNTPGNYGQAYFYFYRGITQLTRSQIATLAPSSGGAVLQIPPSGCSFIDTPAAGTYTYTFQVACATGSASGTSVAVVAATLNAYEL